MENTYEKFNNRTGKRIMELRRHRGYTREQLAEMADISPKFLYEIEVGRKGCSSYILYKLAQALEVDTNYLTQDEIDTENSSSEMIYMQFEDNQKKKIDSIMKLLYEITHSF